MSEWKEVAQPGQVATWKPVEGEELIGTLTGITTGVGANGSTIYEITTPDDVKVAVWETAVIKTKLGALPTGTEVKIKYLGKNKSKNGVGSYHNYSVFTKAAPEQGDLPF